MLTTMVALAAPGHRCTVQFAHISDKLRAGGELPTNFSIIKVNSSKVLDSPLKTRSSPLDF
jgi:hypothetical protein